MSLYYFGFRRKKENEQKTLWKAIPWVGTAFVMELVYLVYGSPWPSLHS